MLLSILLGIQILVCLALIGLVLLQRSEGGALGMGGGGSGNFMSARGAGDFLSRFTWILGGVFFALSLTITLVSGRVSGGSAVDRLNIEAIDPSQLNTAPVAPAPAIPAETSTGGLDAPAAQIRNPFLDSETAPAEGAATAPTTPATPAP
ncbi:MAG: preprotein translocase subunit SecG [Phenylobacterium sp.]|uniref:preprotein translocase subunit SecG n=1 Tax=Phenylobacterium sp. TaxID=1871053 RepID=UPI002737473D|nr:preprotein translocase subunit SecG [Phenylobacterium sp.]MDP1642629.1 preprotein translocase subunit SecG [Phenylobacterium sp.]MDP3118625.1 preprotein translocase subunit SecG [Phenylobacterium sp.]MDP3382444.1 preprotein translocase subunit SecG [Phenylobacterium sp.]